MNSQDFSAALHASATFFVGTLTGIWLAEAS